MKKFEDKAFAAGVDREEVTKAAEKLGVDLKEHVQFVIEAMRGSWGWQVRKKSDLASPLFSQLVS